jgi:hypothetical protein
MENPKRRRQQLKNEWQREARNKTRGLLKCLDEMLLETHGPAASSKRKPHETETRGERQILEEACATLRKATWTHPSTIAAGMATSHSQPFAVVHQQTLVVLSADASFIGRFGPMATPATLADLIHPEDIAQICRAAAALALVPAAQQHAPDVQPVATVRMRSRGASSWVSYALSLVEGTRNKTFGVWFVNQRDPKALVLGVPVQGSAQQHQHQQQQQQQQGAHLSVRSRADLLSSHEIEAVELCNTRLTILAASPALCARFQSLPGTLVGQSITHVLHPGSALSTCEFVRQQLGTAGGQMKEVKAAWLGDRGHASGDSTECSENSTRNGMGSGRGAEEGSQGGDATLSSKSGDHSSKSGDSVHSHASISGGDSCSSEGDDVSSSSSSSSSNLSSRKSNSECENSDDGNSSQSAPDRASDKGGSSGNDAGPSDHDNGSNDGGYDSASSYCGSDSMSQSSSTLTLEREAVLMTCLYPTLEQSQPWQAIPAQVCSYLQRQRAPKGQGGMALELTCPVEVPGAGGKVKRMVLAPRNLLLAGLCAEPGRGVFLLEQRRDEGGHSDGTMQERGWSGEGGKDMPGRQTMRFNEVLSTCDLCSTTWESAKRSASGVDQMWHMMLGKQLSGPIKHTVAELAASAGISKSRQLTRMSQFAVALKPCSVDDDESKAGGGALRVELSHRLVVPGGRGMRKWTCLPWCKTVFVADGGLHQTSAADYYCCMPQRSAGGDTPGRDSREEFAGSGRRQQVEMMIWHLKRHGGALVVYHSQLLTLYRASSDGTPAMTIQGTVHHCVDLDTPEHYLHSFDPDPDSLV